ncbi:MAG TPA: hypothetical protein VFI97_00355 [Arthrobacter sp.]|nr:hypothetical protein [Arthrobacter sp.]
MSEDRQPGHSRRALRTERQSQADNGQQGGYPADSSRTASTGTATSANRPPSRRRAADSPVDAEPARASERESLARARDREALRAYKALAEQDTRKSQQPLTRRQLRQQQLEAERRAAGLSTSRQPIVPPADGSPVDTKNTGAASTGGRGAGSDTAAGNTAPQSAGSGTGQLNNLSVEEALAARSALVEQAKNQMAMLEASGQQQDPRSVDLNVLAEQKKLAERAAVLNRRALAKQRLSEENQQRKPQPNDPAAAHNLAMVTPLEFVKIPGRELPVMKPPTTSHIPVITPVQIEAPKSSTEASNAPADAGVKIPPPPATAPGTKDTRPGDSHGAGSQAPADPASTGPGRSRVLARAEAVASTAWPSTGSREVSGAVATREHTEEGDPISAHTAHGLEPLDAMTAGLGRGNRLGLIQILVMAVGTIAIIVGLIMILGG